MITDLVLLPGLNNTPAVFDALCASLPETIRAHAVDLPAIDTVEGLADHVLASAPERFWLAGFSFGGYVSMAILQRAPERVIGLALICSLPGADGPVQVARRLAAIEVARSGRYAQEAEKVTLPFHPHSLQRPDLMALRSTMIARYGAARHIAHSQACISRPDRTALLDGRCPLLLVTGSHDVVVPSTSVLELAEQLRGRIDQTSAATDRSSREDASAAAADIRSLSIDGAGHLLPMEQPHALATALSAWIGTQPS